MTTFSPNVGDRVKVTAPISATHAVIRAEKDWEGEYFVRFEDGEYAGEYGYLTADQIAEADQPGGGVLVEHEDSDGDALTVQTRPDAPAEPLVLTAYPQGDSGDGRSVYLSPAGVTRLRLALQPYDEAEDGLPLDPARLAAVAAAFELLGGDGLCVDTESLLAIADFLVGDA